MPEFDVKRLNAPLATSFQTFGGSPNEKRRKRSCSIGRPVRLEVAPSLSLAGRRFEVAGENSQIIHVPRGLNLKGTILPSGDHAPRLIRGSC